MRVVYLAGPYRGDVSGNVERACEAARLAMEGREDVLIVVPHLLGVTLDTGQGDAFWLEAMLDLALRCDEVWVMPGWEDSAGTQAEMTAARNRGLPVVYL